MVLTSIATKKIGPQTHCPPTTCNWKMIGRDRFVEDDQCRHNKSSHDVVCLHWAHGSTKANTDATLGSRFDNYHTLP